MGDTKQDVKESVKVFTQTFVSYVVKESTKRLVKSLTKFQRKMLEYRVKNLSDDQLEQYFDKDQYFKSELENTVKSIYQIHPTHGSGFWLENLQMVCESSCIQNLIKVLIQQVTKITFVAVAAVALLGVIATPMVIFNGGPDIDPQLPIANFSSNVTGLSVKFTDQSENAEEWKWEFGDGNSSTERNAMHSYSVAGNYTVSLTANNTNGTNSTFAIITVLEPSAPEPSVPTQETSILPFASFISSVTRGYSPLSVKFTDQSENAAEWNWDFGDGATSTKQNPTHRYLAAGNYSVNLTVINANGTDSTSSITTVLKKPVSIPGEPVLPFANFISSVTRGYVPLSVQFTDKSQNAAEWNWDFGDGTTSTVQDPTHTYFEAGNYTVNLTVANTNGTDSTSATVNVSEKPLLPVANFSINITEGYAPLSVQFTDLSEDAMGWDWGFGDGATSTEQNPVHTYSAAGNYTSLLTVSNTNGTDLKTTTITVLPLPVYAYVTNQGSNTVSLIDTATKEVTDNISVGINPDGIAVTSDGIVYVANSGDESESSSSISVIDTATKTVTDTLSVGESSMLVGIAVNPAGTKVYVTNERNDTVSVIDTETKLVTDTVSVDSCPSKIVVTPDGTKVYVVNSDYGTVSVIDADTDSVTDTVFVGITEMSDLGGAAITPDGKKVYVTAYDDDVVSVIDTATNIVTATVFVGNRPKGVVVTPEGTKAYVANWGDYYISVIDTATNNVTDSVYTINEATYTSGVAVTQDGREVYVTNSGDDSVSIIDTLTNSIIATVPVGESPVEVAIIRG